MRRVNTPLDSVTERELEILRLLNDGLSDHQIADKLILTTSTVKWYNRQIYGKLGVNSRTQAALRARQLGLLTGVLPKESPVVPFHNLPAQTTRFVGRKHESVEVKQLLQTTRLLTLTGSPGTGKTRLALHVASEVLFDFADGVYFVPLAPLTDATLVANTIARTLNVPENAHEPLNEILEQHLHDKQLLLVLDNFEHVLPGALLVAELLAAAPYMKILITSREVLHVYGEQEYFVPPLALPHPNESLSELAQGEAVELFVERARAVKPGFDLTEENALAIAKICVRLDGLPLAIELAAARVKLLAPQDLLARLSSRLEALRRTIDWSYDLLDAEEKTLFARLTVFQCGCTLEAVESVCDENLAIDVLDGLASLVDKSLVNQEEIDGRPRFAMLDIIREYAEERLEASGEAEALRRQHASYYIAYAERIARSLNGAELPVGLNTLEREHNNFRAVLNWSLRSDPEPGLRLIIALAMCWRIHSHLFERVQWAMRLPKKGESAAPTLRARALCSASSLLGCYMGDQELAEKIGRGSLQLAREIGDKQTIAWSLFALGASLMTSEPVEARASLEEALSLFTSVDDLWGVARIINCIGELTQIEGDYEQAGKLYEEGLAFFQQISNPWGTNSTIQNLAYVAAALGDYERAWTLFGEGLITSRNMGDKVSIANCLAGMAGVLGKLGEPERAARLLGAVEALRTTIGVHKQPGNRPDYERNVAVARDQLDTTTFESAWAEGRAMALEQAVPYALAKAV